MQPQQDYYTPKPEHDIDLVAEVERILRSVGLTGQLMNTYLNNRFIQEARGKTSNVQRFLMNRFWTYLLNTSDKLTIEERYCLIPNGSVEDWLRLFQVKIIPFLLDNFSD